MVKRYSGWHLKAYIIIVLSMALCLNMSITVGFGFPYPLWKTILWTIGLTLLFIMLAVFRRIDIIAAAVAVAVVVTIYIRDKGVLLSAVDFSKAVIDWSIRYSSGQINYFPSYAHALLFFIYVIIGAFMSFLILRWNQTFMPVVAGLLVFTVQWYNFVDASIYYMLFFIAAVIVLMALKAYEKQGGAKKMLGNWISLGSMISAAAIIVTTLMPSDIEPVSWPWLNDRFVQAFPVVRELRGGDRSRPLSFVDLSQTFSLSQTGMQRSQQYLGGPAVQDDSVALIAQMPQPAYLRAVVYDLYNGQGWERSRTDWYSYNSGVSLDNSFAPDVPVKTVKVTIQPVNLYTNTIFTLWQPYTVYKADNGKYYASEDNYEVMDPDGRIKKSYTVEALVPVVDVGRLRNSGFDYPSSIKQKYLQLPIDKISSAIKDKAVEITSQYDNPYDKVKAIEEYLRQFPYTLDTPYTPHGRELVEYFLFELQKGYCVYYATSMAVMLRTIGIPTRYVTGFAMPQRSSPDQHYEILNSMAHSWVEVYFNGFGWLPFEPTPAYPASAYGPAEVTTNSSGYYGEYLDETQDYTDEYQSDIVSDNSIPSKNSGFDWWLFMYLPLIIFIIVIARAVYVGIRQRQQWRRWSKGEYAEGIITYYNRIYDLLGQWGLYILPGETPMEFASRACRYMGGHRFQELTEIFQRARYSRHSMSKEELDSMVAFYKRLLESIREQPVTYFRYLWRRYILNAS